MAVSNVGKEIIMSRRSARYSRVVRLAIGLSVTLAILVACSDDPAAPGTGGLPPLSPVLVSAPDSRLPAGPAKGGTIVPGLGVVYVSMPPGTDPLRHQRVDA